MAYLKSFILSNIECTECKLKHAQSYFLIISQLLCTTEYEMQGRSQWGPRGLSPQSEVQPPSPLNESTAQAKVQFMWCIYCVKIGTDTLIKWDYLQVGNKSLAIFTYLIMTKVWSYNNKRIKNKSSSLALSTEKPKVNLCTTVITANTSLSLWYSINC